MLKMPRFSFRIRTELKVRGELITNPCSTANHKFVTPSLIMTKEGRIYKLW